MNETGAMMLIYLTIWANLSPYTIPQPPTAQLGPFDNAAFIGPIVGGITNWLLLTLFTFSFGAVSGAHRKHKVSSSYPRPPYECCI